jgi:hypothetical protein
MLRLCHAPVISPTKNPRCQRQTRERVGRKKISADTLTYDEENGAKHAATLSPTSKVLLATPVGVPTCGRTLGRPIFTPA